MTSHRIMAAAVLALALCTSGCGRISEVDETAFVFTITLDPGEQNRLQVGIRIPVPRLVGKIQGQAAGATTDPQSLYLTTSAQAPTIMDSIALMQTYLSRRISLEHTRSIVVAETLARADIEPLMRTLMREPQLRSTSLLFVSKGTAFRILTENRPVLEINASKYAELITYWQDVTGMIRSTQIGEFYNMMISNAMDGVIPLVAINEKVLLARKQQEREKAGGPVAPDPARAEDIQAKQEKPAPNEDAVPKRTPGSFLPGHLPRDGGNVLEFMGVAVFRKGKMVGELSGNETLALNLLTGRFKLARVTVHEPGNPNKLATTVIYPGRPTRLAVELTDGKPVLHARIVVDADIDSLESSSEMQSAVHVAELERLVAQQLHRWAESAITKTQAWQADVFGFGQKARRHFATWDEWEKFDWASHYKEAELKLEVKVNLRRTGLITGRVTTR